MLLPQNDQVWINYVNHWIDVKRERGFFKELEAQVAFRQLIFSKA